MLTDENKTPDTPTPASDDVQAVESERIIRLSKPEDEPIEAEASSDLVASTAPSVSEPSLHDPVAEPAKPPAAPTPSHSDLESADPAPSLSDPINRDKEATGEMAVVRPTKPAKASKSKKASAEAESPAPLEDDPPVIIDAAPQEETGPAPEPQTDHGTMTPTPTPSASEIVANAQKKAAEIVEDRVNMSGSVRMAKNARYEAIQETKQANAAFEKAADEVGSVTDKLEGSLGVMDFLLDKELNDILDAAPDAKSSTTPAAMTPPASGTSSAAQEPEWKRRATELYEQKRQQEQDIIERRRAQSEATLQQRTAQEDQLKAGREALEARLREERAANEARMKTEREAVEAKRHAEQERLRAERAAMDARLKEEREAKEAERRASKKLGRPGD
jgi:hypothetical protein